MSGSVDPSVTSIKIGAVISAGMSAKLTALITEYGDSIPLPVPDKYWYSPQTRFPEKVNIVIIPGLDVRRNLGGEKANGQAILIGLVVAGNDTVSPYSPTEVLTLRLWRYTRAILEILEANNKLTVSGTDYADEMLVEDMTPYDLAPLDDGPGFEQRLEMTLTVRTS